MASPTLKAASLTVILTCDIPMTHHNDLGPTHPEYVFQSLRLNLTTGALWCCSTCCRPTFSSRSANLIANMLVGDCRPWRGRTGHPKQVRSLSSMQGALQRQQLPPLSTFCFFCFFGFPLLFFISLFIRSLTNVRVQNQNQKKCADA